MTDTGQKRTRTACEPCHKRKRKCDGSQPCNTCERNGYRCSYRPPTKAQPHSLVESPSGSTKPAFTSNVLNGSGSRPSAANSGPLFLRQLLMKIDPAQAPKAQLTAWNVGPRESFAPTSPNSGFGITGLLSHEHMTTLATVFFDKIDPCYGFIERDRLFQQINNRWLSLSSFEPSDALLSGVAALGSYFSKAYAIPVEPQLAQLAKSILDSSSPTTAPDSDIVTAWVCHVIYLRFTSTPFAVWVASCTTMHILEAAGLHRDAITDETLLTRQSPNNLSQPLRRAFGVAQHLNTWVSYDLGLSRVKLQGPEISPDSVENDNYTDKLLELLPTSLGLDSVSNQDDEYLRINLRTIVAKDDKQPPLIMAQCNLVLCILRQLQARSSLRTDHHQALDAALAFLEKGLAAARQMVEDDTPWHHLANVPFQTLCTVLMIDTPTSLKIVDDAIQTLQTVANAYPTATLKEAYNTACLVLCLHRQRRLNDAQIIDTALSRLPIGGETMLDPGQNNPVEQWNAPNEREVAWIEALMGEFPSLQTVDVGNLLNDYSSIPLQ